MWTTACNDLLSALDAERVLPPLREALELGAASLQSTGADLALVAELREEPRLRPALTRLFEGDAGVLSVVLGELFPDQLRPTTVHQLSLAWLWCGSTARRGSALRGLLWLWDRHRDVLVDAVGESVGKPAAVQAVESLVEHLLDVEESAIVALGTSGDRVAGRAAWARLQELELWARHDGLSDRALAAVDIVRVRARSKAVAGTIERCQAAVSASERRSASGDPSDLGAVFADALALRSTVGDDEVLSAWVVAQAVELAWPLHHDQKGSAVSALLDPLRPFADDLGVRLRAGEAFGHQATFADFQVMMAQSLRTELTPTVLYEARRALLLQGLEVCSVHRNTRVCLAAADVGLVELRLTELEGLGLKARFDRTRVRALLEETEKLLSEARAMRPERADLAGLAQRLEAARTRWS